MGQPIRTPESALAELELRLRKTQASILEGLRPGLSPADARRLLGELGAPVDPAIEALYCWHDGADGSGPPAELLAGVRFLSLEEAIEVRQFELGLASENEFLPDLPASEIFDPAWFPFLVDAGGLVYVMEQYGAGRVLLIDRQYIGNPEELASSLIAFLDCLAQDGLDFKPPPLSNPALELVRRMESPDEKEQTRAVGELTRKRPPAAYQPLVSMLDSQNPQARRNAALLLGRLGDPRAVPLLIRCAARWEARDATSALAGLRDIGDEGYLGHLEAALVEGDVELRMNAAAALAKTRDARAVPALQAASAGDADPKVRAAAAQALATWSKPS